MISKKAKNKRAGKASERENSRFPIIFVFIIIIIGGFLIFSNWQMNQRRQQLLSKTRELEKEIAVIEKRNEELKLGIASASQESYLEREARETLQLKKPGEKVVAVVPPEKTIDQASKEPLKTFWQKILAKLGL